jgi:hypothetical protein
MATIQEIQEQVLQITGRYERVDFINSRVLAAIRVCHTKALFPLDSQEDTIEVTSTDGGFTGYITLPSRFRTLAIAKGVDYIGNTVAEVLTYTTPQKIAELTRQGRVEETYNTCYMAGTRLSYKALNKVHALVLYYYSLPDLSDSSFSTWITTEYPEAVADLACYYVYSQSGDKESANSFLQVFTTQHEPSLMERVNSSQFSLGV